MATEFSTADVINYAFCQQGKHENGNFGVHISFERGHNNFFIDPINAIHMFDNLRRCIQQLLNDTEVPENIRTQMLSELKWQEYQRPNTERADGKNPNDMVQLFACLKTNEKVEQKF